MGLASLTCFLFPDDHSAVVAVAAFEADSIALLARRTDRPALNANLFVDPQIFVSEPVVLAFRCYLFAHFAPFSASRACWIISKYDREHRPEQNRPRGMQTHLQ
jgi:hypothetical protein